MKCNQCDSMVVTYGNSVPVFCHEQGCPNTNKVYDKDEDEWVTPEDWDNQDEDRGGTGHGDISWSDADPGL